MIASSARTLLLLALLCLSVVLVAGCGGDSRSDSGPDSSSSESEGADLQTAAENRCFSLWNDAEDHAGKTMVSNSGNQSTVYVSVGFDATFPDRCFVTTAVPDFGRAQQFRESSGPESGQGAFTFAGSGTVDQLPESAKHWNATADPEGNLVPGAP